MELFSPVYYQKFKCIAAECRHSCCIGWEIGVDRETLQKYKDHRCGDILSRLEITDGRAEIKLLDDGRCPFLDGGGLCRIISELGEEYTSEICREHPRFYHRVGDICEVGLGCVCEEAARMILGEADFTKTVRLGDSFGDLADTTEFDTLSHRDAIYSILSDTTLGYREKIQRVADEYGVAERLSSDLSELFSELECLEEEDRVLFAAQDEEGRRWVQEYALRFFAYLVFRHVSVAENYDNLRARVGFCLLLLQMLEGGTAAIEDITFEDITDLVRRISAEIEYSEDNTSAIIFDFESEII